MHCAMCSGDSLSSTLISLTFDSDENKAEVENKNSFTTLHFRKDEAQIYPTQTERRDSQSVSSAAHYYTLTVASIGQRGV